MSVPSNSPLPWPWFLVRTLSWAPRGSKLGTAGFGATGPATQIPLPPLLVTWFLSTVLPKLVAGDGVAVRVSYHQDPGVGTVLGHGVAGDGVVAGVDRCDAVAVVAGDQVDVVPRP